MKESRRRFLKTTLAAAAAAPFAAAGSAEAKTAGKGVRRSSPTPRNSLRWKRAT